MILEGVTVPLITPLNEDQSLDHESLARTIDHVISGGVDAIFVLGTSGEFANLTRKTKDELVVTAKTLIGKRAANKRLPSISTLQENVAWTSRSLIEASCSST